MLFPFALGARTNARSVHAHPFARLPASKLRVHTSRAVSTILKGSCRSRTFPAGKEPRTTYSPPPPPSPPCPFPTAFVLRLFPPPSLCLSHALPDLVSSRFRVSSWRNQCGEYVHTQWERDGPRLCLPSEETPSKRRDQRERERGGCREEEGDGRRRRQLEATETSCIPGH